MNRKFTPILLVSLFLFLGCSKDFLKKYDKRVLGEWSITDIDRRGFGGDIDYLPFQEGSRFTFQDGGSLTYVDENNNTYNGTWDIIKKRFNEQTVRSLEISVANFANQQTLFENYDDMNFVGTNHFKTTIYSGAHSYITHFRR